MYFKKHEEYIRSGVFGFEDAVVSTCGLVVGLITSAPGKPFILLAGFIAISVAALSAGTSELISEETIEEIEKKPTKGNIYIAAFIMFFSYILGGLVPLSPVIFIDNKFLLPLVIVLSFLGLILLGYIKGKLIGVSTKKSVFQIILVGGLAAVVGIIVGYFFKV